MSASPAGAARKSAPSRRSAGRREVRHRSELCTNCGASADVCPVEAISPGDGGIVLPFRPLRDEGKGTRPLFLFCGRTRREGEPGSSWEDSRSVMAGRFITFEASKVRKTTQIRLAGDFLRERGLAVVMTQEPGGTPLGEPGSASCCSTAAASKFRARPRYFSSPRPGAAHRHRDPPPWRRAKSFSATVFRRHHRLPGLRAGTAPGARARNLPHRLRGACAAAHPHVRSARRGGPRKGLPADRRPRGQSPQDRFEREHLDFHRRIREGYLAIARQEPDRVQVLDASKGIDPPGGRFNPFSRRSWGVDPCRLRTLRPEWTHRRPETRRGEAARAPAFLFYGAEGVGKRTTALVFAKAPTVKREAPTRLRCCASCRKIDGTTTRMSS
jgi:dTMP kinase